MHPIKFAEQNCVYAKDQPEYLPLPVYKTEDGMVISCWGLTWRERFKLLFTGRIYWSVLTFNRPLQPQLPLLDSPFQKSKVTWYGRLGEMLRAFAVRMQEFTGPERVKENIEAPWWMGLAYIDFCRREYVMWAVPLHHLVFLTWKLNQLWCRYRGRVSWIEREINKAIQKDRERRLI